MRGIRPRADDRRAVRRLRPPARAAGFPPRALVRHGDHPAAGAIPYVPPTARQAGARRRGGGCVHLVRADVSHREAHGDGMDEIMALRNAERGMRNAEWARRTVVLVLVSAGLGMSI